MWWIGIVIVGLVALIYLEGRRQAKKYGPASGAPGLRSGILELQRHLEPERKMEILLEENEESEEADSGDPPNPTD